MAWREPLLPLLSVAVPIFFLAVVGTGAVLQRPDCGQRRARAAGRRRDDPRRHRLFGVAAPAHLAGYALASLLLITALFAVGLLTPQRGIQGNHSRG